MSLRSRLALAFAVVAAVVALLVGVLSYRAASDRITDEVDRTLASVSAAVAAGETGVLATSEGDPGDGPDEGRGRGRRGDGDPLVAQAVAPNGAPSAIGGRRLALPVNATDRALATATTAGGTATTEIDLGRDAYRVRTTALGGGRGALQVAVDVDESSRVLTGTAIDIAWVSLIVLIAAAGAGWLLARRITRRLVRLAGAAEEVSVRGGLEHEVPVEGRDEVGRLSASFNTMVRRLAASREAQERLVQDAAHELRTPLTSLRTNASVLRRVAELSPEARERLLDDVQGETRELSRLVDELVELALDRRGEEPEEAVDLGAVAQRAAQRVQRRTGRAVHIDTDGSVVRGRPAALERAAGNLLENAVKFDGDGDEPIGVRVRQGTITVTDRGPGIDAADAVRVFDRFYRSDAARGLPGSGLGLAIVRDVAESHGGTVFASTPSGGGAAVGFGVGPERLLPSSESDHDEASPRSITVGDT
ncbi:HAMP domain-containing sensor histidine kinase [Actinomycetospora sp. CA-101289]|uniref:HAMP domain-containing sensor histidine kinase n=1 Tax=Actinomycetospora sp. CA-101289 TaxID=3239893 RepID=UPI003D96FD5A